MDRQEEYYFLVDWFSWQAVILSDEETARELERTTNFRIVTPVAFTSGVLFKMGAIDIAQAA